MKKLIFLCLAIAILSQPYSFSTEGTVFNPPIPKPKLSIEKALELLRAKHKKDNPDRYEKLSSVNIVFSVEYRSYHYIKNNYGGAATTMEKVSKEGNWEWVIKYGSTEISDSYSTYMVTQNGKVLLMELCCL